MEKLEHLYTAEGNVRWYNCFGKIVWQFYKKLNIELIYDTAFPLLCTY